MCFQGYGRSASPMGPAHNVDQIFYLGKYPASSTIGLPLPLGTPEVSISSVCSKPSVPGSPAPSWIPQTLSSFYQDLSSVSCFVATWYGTLPSQPRVAMCVHMCPHVCMCSLQLLLLGHVAPSPSCHRMSQVSLPWLQSAISWKCRGHRRSGSALWNRM